MIAIRLVNAIFTLAFAFVVYVLRCMALVAWPVLKIAGMLFVALIFIILCLTPRRR